MQKVRSGLWCRQIGDATIHVMETADSLRLAGSRHLIGARKRELMKSVVAGFFKEFAHFFRRAVFSWVLIERGGRFVAPTVLEMEAWWGKRGPITPIEMKRVQDKSKESGWGGRFLWGLGDLFKRPEPTWVVGETCLASGTTLHTLVSVACDHGRQPNHLVVVCPIVGSYGLRRLLGLCQQKGIKLTVFTTGIWWVNEEGYESTLPYTDFVLRRGPVEDDDLYFVTPASVTRYRINYGDKPVCVVGDAGDSMAVGDDGREDMRAQCNYMRDTITGFERLGLDSYRLLSAWPIDFLKSAVA